MIATLGQDLSLDGDFWKDILQVIGPEVVAHWVIVVIPERCASVVKESLTHRADTFVYITRAAQHAPHLIYGIVNGI